MSEFGTTFEPHDLAAGVITSWLLKFRVGSVVLMPIANLSIRNQQSPNIEPPRSENQTIVTSPIHSFF